MRLKVEYARLGDLAPYANNSKEHPSWQVEQIANSIDQFGFNDPVGVWTNPDGVLEIVEGHGRVMACKELGWDDDAKVPIVKLDHLDDDARRAYVHVHNQTTLTSGLDSEMLKIDMEQLGDFDWGAFGFEQNDDIRHMDADSVGQRESSLNSITVLGKKFLVADDEANMLYDGLEEYARENGLSIGYVRALYETE